MVLLPSGSGNFFCSFVCVSEKLVWRAFIQFTWSGTLLKRLMRQRVYNKYEGNAVDEPTGHYAVHIVVSFRRWRKNWNEKTCRSQGGERKFGTCRKAQWGKECKNVVSEGQVNMQGGNTKISCWKRTVSGQLERNAFKGQRSEGHEKCFILLAEKNGKQGKYKCLSSVHAMLWFGNKNQHTESAHEVLHLQCNKILPNLYRFHVVQSYDILRSSETI